MKNNATCSRCGKGFRLGTNGIRLDGKDVCDSCAGVKRDASGHFWLPEERVHTYVDTANDKKTWFKVKRADAFKSK